MGTFIGDTEQLADMVGKGVELTIKDALRTKLEEFTKPMIEEALTKLAKDITAHVQTYQNHLDGKVEVHVTFNTIERRVVARRDDI